MEQNFFKEQVRGNFNLRTPKCNKPSLLYFVISIGKKHYKIPTGVKVYPDQWNKKHQRAVISHKLTEQDNINNRMVNEKIDAVLFCFTSFLTYICNNPTSLEEGVQPVMYEFFKINTMRKANKQLNIIQFLTEAAYNKGGQSAPNQLAYLKHLEAYLAQREMQGLGKVKTFKELASTSVFRGFQDYMLQEHKGRYKVSYVNEMTSKLLTMLRNYVIGDGESFLSRPEIDAIDIKKIPDRSSDRNEVWLSNDEVMRLWRHTCKNKRDEEIRDLFILECTVGHRYSDIKHLVEHTHTRDGIMYCNIVTKKTSQSLTVPIVFDLARQILAKYKDTGLPSVHPNTYRNHIKDICREVGITSLVAQAHHYAGDASARATQVPKYKRIGTHTARRTFVSLLSLRGFQDNKIGKFTGQSANTVERYLRGVTALDHEIYKKQRKEHPDDIVKTIDEVDNGSLLTSGIHDEASVYGSADKLKELREVLVYLGASYEDIADIANEDELNAMLYGDYERKLIDAGVKRGTLKSIYNTTGMTLKEKKTLLARTVEEVAEVVALTQ